MKIILVRYQTVVAVGGGAEMCKGRQCELDLDYI